MTTTYTSLKVACAERGISLKKLCAKAGVPYASIARWKNAEPKSIATLDALRRELAIIAKEKETGAGR